MSVRFRICLMAWIAVLAVTLINKHAPAQTQELTPVPEEVLPAPVTQQPLPPVETEWVVNIQPSQKAMPSRTQVPGHCEGCDAKANANADEYTRIYNSIPFNRAEYNVNPSYRHDAAMEILTGNARHKTIVRHDATQPVATHPPITIQPRNPSRYGYLRPALRLNYYRNFPSLNPYINVRNYSGAY